MPFYNVINPEAVDRYLDIMSERDSKLARLLKVALRKPILNHPSTLQRIDNDFDLAANAIAPAPWLIEKLKNGEALYFFHHRGEHNSTVMHVKDWIKAAIKRDEPWTKEDKPTRLTHFKTLDEAHEAADRASGALREKFDLGAADPTDGTTVIMEFPDGWKIRRLISVEAKKYDGKRLKHCVGDGAYDDAVIYSLRDLNENPAITMQVSRGDVFVQCRGLQNAPPTEKAMPYIRDFANYLNLNVPGQRGNLNSYYRNSVNSDIIEHNGQLYSFHNLPAGIVLQHALDLTRTQGRLKLPEYMQVPSLVIRAKNIPENAQNRNEIKTNVQIPDSLSVPMITFKVAHKGKLHSLDGPAETTFLNGEKAEHWYKHGKLHREGKPAITYYDYLGRIVGSEWALEGERIPVNDKRVRAAYDQWRHLKNAHNAAIDAPNPSPPPPA